MYSPSCIPHISSHWDSSSSDTPRRAHERLHIMTSTWCHPLPAPLHTRLTVCLTVCTMRWFEMGIVSYRKWQFLYKVYRESSLPIKDNLVLGSWGHQCSRAVMHRASNESVVELHQVPLVLLEQFVCLKLVDGWLFYLSGTCNLEVRIFNRFFRKKNASVFGFWWTS